MKLNSDGGAITVIVNCLSISICLINLDLLKED